ADPGSPVAVAHYRLCAADGSGCQPAGQLAAPGISGIDGISVPSEGEWTLQVWLEDAAGNVNSANVATTTLRYGSPPATSTEPTTSTQPETQPAPAPSDAPA